MFIVGSVVEVDAENCIGCKACDRVCPTEAIQTLDKLARVKEGDCIGCMRCIEACGDHNAINRKILEKPVFIRADESLTSEDAIAALCKKARLAPRDIVCPCTGTKAREVATAVLNGATKPGEATVGAGVRSVCSMWCTSAVIRLLGAAGHEVELDPKNWYIYPDGLEPSLWTVPSEVAEKYPEYRLGEMKEKLKTGDVSLGGFPRIVGDCD